MEQIYRKITDYVVQKIQESGRLPWTKPWNCHELAPRNISKREYRGVNVWLTLFDVERTGCPFFASAKQINAAGGWIKKGSKSTPIVFWKFLSSIVKNKEGKQEIKEIPFLRYYNVFNIADTTLGWEKEKAIVSDIPVLEQAETIVSNMPLRPEIKYMQSNRAYYTKTHDFINMPERNQFKSQEGFYSTLFHELSHSTGHQIRLNRVGFDGTEFQGSHNYSYEELVAELSASFLCGNVGIINELDQTAAYIQSWIKSLQNNPKWIIQASGAAQKSAEYILGKTPSETKQNKKTSEYSSKEGD